MKRSNLKSKSRKNRLAHRFLALLTVLSAVAALILPDHDILPLVSAANGEDNNDLLVSFDFNNSTGGFLSDNGIEATLENYIIGTDNEHGNYLDLTNSDAYLSLPGSILADLDEMTVEMLVKTNDDVGPNWAFFAAPDGNEPANRNEHYLGILLNRSVTVERYAIQDDVRPINPSGEWTASVWHRIKVVFAENSTQLYIDDMETAVSTEVSVYSLKDCLGENGVLWFGRSAWLNIEGKNEGFNGCIDDIRISGKSAVAVGNNEIPENDEASLYSENGESFGNDEVSVYSENGENSESSENSPNNENDENGENSGNGETSLYAGSEIVTEKEILSLDFEGEGDAILANKSGSGKADAVGEVTDKSKLFGTENDNTTCLDLTNTDAYLSLDGGLLNGLTEMTVEMRVKTNTNGTNWAFLLLRMGIIQLKAMSITSAFY